MKIFFSIIVGLVVCVCMAVAEKLFTPEDENVDTNGLVAAIGIGALVGVVHYFVPKFTPDSKLGVLAPICLVAMILVSCYFMYEWGLKGSSLTEMLPFLAATIPVFFVTKEAAAMTAIMMAQGQNNNTFWISVIMVVPTLMLISTIGFYVINMLNFYYYEVRHDDFHKILLFVAVIATMATVIAVVCTQVSWGSLTAMPARAEAEEVVGDYVETEATDGDVTVDAYSDAEFNYDNMAFASWYKFYNLFLSTDADPRNDFNFGSNPFAEGLNAYDYATILRNRMKEDPALAAAVMAWLDANVGTRYLGEFYESCKGDWAKTINLTKVRFMEDQGLFYQTLDAFFAFLNTADSVELEYRTEGLDDQMYMNSYTVDGVPDVIVMTTTDHAGYFLTFVFVIKADNREDNEGNKFRVSYRIDCGFQPTNVEKVMNIKPDDTPRTSNPGHSSTPKSDPTPNPGGKDDPTPKPDPKPTPKPQPTPDPTPKPDPTPEPQPTPKPDPTPTPEQKKKDKTKGTKENTEPNDDPGPGPDTNNGVGAQYSTKDQETNSNHMNEQEYKETVKELKEINETQKTGNDPSTPSTTGPANTEVHVDSNADKGTGNGGINTPTEKTDPAIVAATDQPISDSPGEAWEGPMD